MSAKFTIIKYTGRDSDFGTEVSSIGLKRVDAAVPAVYGDPVVPGDDTSDAMMYSVYRPELPDDVAYSFESIFKLKLVEAPDNQVSNVRIYPKEEKPNDPYRSVLKIGVSSNGYTRPTNTASMVAVHDIWNFTKESPFKISVGGIDGTELNPVIAEQSFNITLADIGTGNLIYLNKERQATIQLVEPRIGHADRTYTFVDQTDGDVIFTVYDPDTNTPVTHPSITTDVDGDGRVITHILADNALNTAYPNGILYGSSTDVSVGGLLEWIDLDGDPITTETYEVEIRTNSQGKDIFFLNGIRQPNLNFELNRKYVFNNVNGDTNPMRFMWQNSSKAVESNIVIDGVKVINGGTVNEIIEIDPIKVNDSGYKIVAYQSTTKENVGGGVSNTQTNYQGYYNINTVGGGTNPLAAGETDFIYLQLVVKGNSTVGNVVPELVIEYDEN